MRKAGIIFSCLFLLFGLSSCGARKDYSTWNFSDAAKSAASTWYDSNTEEYRSYCEGFDDGIEYFIENGYMR